jgi:hypothetical protein
MTALLSAQIKDKSYLTKGKQKKEKEKEQLKAEVKAISCSDL